jgi:serine/threonine protein kinase
MMPMMEDAPTARLLGRYALYGEFAAGGMAKVHFGHVRGKATAPRTVAIKCLRPEFGSDPGFTAVFVDEALRAARVQHPNVVRTLDVITDRAEEGGEKEIFLVMEYVEGESLAGLLRALRARKGHVPAPIASAILVGVLHGLDAAHEATSEDGAPLGIVHRDLSPQNVMVGTDGLAHVLDFGIGSATGETHTTRAWRVEAKLGYMSPEGLSTGTFTARSDVYSAAVMLWELLTLRRLFEADSQGELMVQVARANVVAPSTYAPGLSPELDRVVLRGLARDPLLRWTNAGELASALEWAGPVAQPEEVAAWVRSLAGDTLTLRARLVAEMEAKSASARTSEASESTRNGSEPVPQGFTRPSADGSEGPGAPRRVGRGQLLIAAGFIALLVAALPLLFMREPGPAVSAPPSREGAAREGAPREVVLAPSSDPNPNAPPPLLPEPVPPATGVPAEGDPVPSASPESVTPAPPEAKHAEAAPAASFARPKPSIQSPAGGGGPDCDPPFTLDALGHKHFKVQCL